MARNKDFFVNSTPKRDKSFFVKEDTKKVDDLWVESTAPNVLQNEPKQQLPNALTLNPNVKRGTIQAPAKRTLGGEIGNFFKATLPQAAGDLWDDIKEPFVGKSERQLLTEAKLSPKLLVEDAKKQLAKENPTREDYALVKQTQDVIKKYGTDESNIRAISEDTTQLQKDLERAEKTWQASPVDAAVANTGAAVTGIFGNLGSFANSLGADKVPLLKEVTNFAVDGARKAQENAQQYNKGDYGEALGTVTQGIVNLVPYFLIGTGTTAVKGATTVTKYGKYIEPIVKNPSFWYSLTSMWGQKYQEKLDEGYNRFQALGNAILYALPASLIEVSGGIGAKGKEAQSLLRTMGEEIAEEIAQDIMSGVSDKITTNHDLPVFSTTEDAIINPKELGKTALYTAPIVAIGGGANNVINNSINNRVENQKAQAQINQDLQNLRNQNPQNVNSTIQRENVTGLPKLNTQNQAQIPNIEQPNVTLPTRTETAQSTNMEQITQTPNLPTQKAQETLQSAKIAGMTDMDIQKAKELNDMLRSGTRLKFYDPQNIPQGVDVSRAADANGFYMDGTLWINKNSEMKVERILGHELTHHVENDDLINTILDSNIFYDFLSEKGFSNTAEFKKYLMEKKGYKQEELTSEMVAHFAEEKLFGKEETINRLARENRTLAQKILNWISDLKTKIAGSSEAKELLRIENMYRKALEQARNTENIVGKTQYHISSNLSNDIDNVLNNITERNPVKLREYTPTVLVQNGVKDLPMYENPSHIRKNILTENEARNLGLQVNQNDHYHGLGKDIYIKAIDSLDDPRVVLKYKNRANEYIILTVVKDNQNNNIIVPIEVTTDTYVNNVKIDINRIKSVYGYDRTEPDLNKYIKDNIKNNNLEKIYEKKKPSAGKTTQSTSNNSINLNDSSVNTEYAQENKKDTAGKEPAFSMPEIPKGYTRLYRGLTKEFDKNYDKKMLDNSNGYESWTDSYELAKAYGDNVYYIDIPTNEIKNGIIDEDSTSETYGDRNLIYSNDKPVGIKGKSGNEYMLYTDHDNYSDIEYKKVEETDKVSFSLPETDNQGRTLSKEQQEFFKDSKVRDENGKLLEVYHGTNTKFTQFSKGTANGWLGKGIYLTINKDYAKKQGKKVMPVYANLKNPFVSKSNDPFEFLGEVQKIYPGVDDFNVAEVLEKNGYDGIIYTHWDTDIGTMVNVFNPNQIKNVDNTNPTENPDIRYSMNPVEVAKNTSKSQESSLLNEIAPIDDKKLETVEEKETTASILTKSPKRPAKDLLKQSVDVVMRKLVDAGNTINTVGKLTGDKHLYEYFNNTKQARQSAEYMIGEAQTDIKGNRVGNSLIRIFEEVRSKGDAYTNEFFEYLLHMHNIDRMAQNKPVFGASVTAEDSRKIANQLLEKHPEFEKQANKVYAYNRNLMQWRVDSGLISKEQADLMNEMYPHYVPTFRDVSGTSGSRAMQGTVQIANTVRKATGSNKDIMPIDASMARQTMQTVQAAKRNLLGNRLLNDALNNKDKVGEYIQAVEKTTEQNDLETELDTPKDTNLDSNNNVFKIFRNGETYVMQVNNGIYEGLKSISSEIDNTDTKLLLKPVKAANTAFKQLITGYSPMFTIRNFARDIQDSGLYSKELRKFIKKYPNTYKEMMGNGKMWQLYKSLGGTGSSFFDYETGIEKTLDSRNKVSTKIKEATLGKVEELNMMIEQAPRFAEFMATIEKAGNQNYDTLMEAMLNAADVTVNFGRSGTVVKEWNSTFVPFLNPSIQGFDKLTRTVLESKDGKKFAKLAIRATLLGILPSVINELLYWDDEEYENLTDRDKDTNFLIKTGDNKWLKIPKGRVLSIFGNTAARGLRTLKGEKWDAGEYLKNQASQTAPISVFDSNLYSPIQAVQNNKTWYGSDIVPQRLQDYAPKDQYDENTDAFSKWLGGKINYSPKKINYLIDAYTGVIGDVALPLTTPKAETNPFTKAFVLDGVTSNEISNDFYNMLDKYNPKQNPKKSAKEVSRYLNKQSSQVSDIYKQIREVENSDISDDEKRKQVRELRELANTIELTAMATVPEYEKAVDKYRGTFADEDVDSDYAYLFANRDIFGAEYAVKTFSKSLYNNHKNENMDTFFKKYFTKQYFQKKIDPKETKTANPLPTLAEQRAKLKPLKK